MDIKVKIYRNEKGIVLIGKPHEIQSKLKEYVRLYETLDQLIQSKNTRKGRVLLSPTYKLSD
ncbi:Z-ring formation inhibitor MciZ [Metabacillus litoralis]|uniref:Z-ring formation inhibitor MciZ n=1 Tax=Metabacillus litoralis TaxID=152268 RepID=UPI001F01E1A4|nr:Z-ring formation inhibitor MciZ [Metabacillus litoralis]